MTQTEWSTKALELIERSRAAMKRSHALCDLIEAQIALGRTVTREDRDELILAEAEVKMIQEETLAHMEKHKAL